MRAFSLLFSALAILQSSYAQCEGAGICDEYGPQICDFEGDNYVCSSNRACIPMYAMS
jgi:hypothetical protein